jgi:hypothetical protein
LSYFYDNWRSLGEHEPDLGWWVGYTVLTYNGFHLPWTEEEGGPDHGDEGDGGDPDDEEIVEEAEEESPT